MRHSSGDIVSPCADSPLVGAALELLRRGFPITLCVGKKPLGQGWTAKRAGKAWQHYRWTPSKVERAFQVRGELNVGLHLGPESGLIDIEADGEHEEALVAELFHGVEPPVTPTFQSRRGKHRLYQWHDDLSATGKGIVYFRDLGIRVGANGKGAQSIVPPSLADGVARKWLVSLEDCDPAPLPVEVLPRIVRAASPVANIREASTKVPRTANESAILLGSNDDSHSRSILHVSSESTVSAESTALTVLHPEIEKAITATLPTEPGQRHRQIFEFARHLKAIASIRDAEASTLKGCVLEWHRRALPTMTTKDFVETWVNFGDAWRNVKFAAGSEPIVAIYQNALSGVPPIAALQYGPPALRNLVALCAELQRQRGDNPFFLDCRTAGKLIEVDHVQAHRWLKLLVLDGVLRCVSIGTRRKASEYRYIHAL